MAKTLEELKLENAAAEADQQDNVVDTAPEQVEDGEIVEDDDVDAGDEGEQAGESGSSESLEDWMQSDDQASHDNDTVSVGVLAKVRGKLKDKVHERDDEIAQLRSQIEQLKNGGQQSNVNTQQLQVAARPKREDFYDQDDPDLAYDLAVDKWQDDRFEFRQTQSAQSNQANQQQQQQLNQIKQASDGHYQRAEKLVSDGTVTADSFVKADTNVRSVIEQVFPGAGDQTTDALIAQLSSVGEGSEKVMYYLGNNASALNTLRDKLTNDKSGLQAMVYLGSLIAKSSQSPTKKVSQAPRPASQLKGDQKGGQQSGPAMKKYQAAHKSGNTQAAFNIKREARAAGIDTSQW